jgi:hypothetical protein
MICSVALLFLNVTVSSRSALDQHRSVATTAGTKIPSNMCHTDIEQTSYLLVTSVDRWPWCSHNFWPLSFPLHLLTHSCAVNDELVRKDPWSGWRKGPFRNGRPFPENSRNAKTAHSLR